MDDAFNFRVNLTMTDMHDKLHIARNNSQFIFRGVPYVRTLNFQFMDHGSTQIIIYVQKIKIVQVYRNGSIWSMH